MFVSIIIPTLNAAKSIEEQLKGIPLNGNRELIIIDSSSSDKTIDIAQAYGANTYIISRSDFNHGGTRNKAAELANGDILVFLTQDALPTDEQSINNLIEPIINNKQIGMTYGRQIPYPESDIFGRFARLNNYPAHTRIKSIADKEKLGIKTTFVSNSFAAYRRELFDKVGKFPTNTILSEDTYVASKMLLEGYSIGYIAEATVYHSHSYSIAEEFKRYFDIGVFYGSEKWIIENFAKAEGEGIKYVKEELKYLLKEKKPYLIPESIVRNGMKYFGYKLGMMEEKIPISVKKKLSMHKFFWEEG